MTLVLKSGYSFDSDSSTYIDAVETADGQALETGVRIAINDFVLGCKQDGIWNAIKASCIMAGARTLDGALVPLTGGAPTNNNFVAGDYDRETGLKGNGSSKSLNSNRLNSADPQDSKHASVYVTEAHGSAGLPVAPTYLGSGSSSNADLFVGVSVSGGNLTFALNNGGLLGSLSRALTGFMGASRSQSSGYLIAPGNVFVSATSGSPSGGFIGIFTSYEVSVRSINYTDARLSFYSIGEALDPALLDTRVSNLMTAIGAAIP